jgi:hypothetical protein
LNSATKQQVKWLVASAGSPPLRQAAATLGVMLFEKIGVSKKIIFLSQI